MTSSAPWRAPLLAGLIVAIALGGLALRSERSDLAYACHVRAGDGTVLEYHATSGMPLPVSACAAARDAALAAHDARTWAYRAASLAVFLAAVGLTTPASRRNIRVAARRAATLTVHRIARGPS